MEVIVANVNAALAAKAATTTVPIVFATGSDPVVDGLVASLNRPGGNVTGVSFVSGLLGAKRLDMLRQLVPNAATMAMLVGTDTLEARIERRDVELAAQALGQQLIIAPVSSEGEFDDAFMSIVGRGAKALLVGTGPFLTSNRERVVGLAARHAIPAIYAVREFVVVGGLLSYGASLADAYRQAGIYAGRVLKGEKPADLPVVQSTKFELVINAQTARTLGLTVPPSPRVHHASRRLAAAREGAAMPDIRAMCTISTRLLRRVNVIMADHRPRHANDARDKSDPASATGGRAASAPLARHHIGPQRFELLRFEEVAPRRHLVLAAGDRADEAISKGRVAGP